MGSVEGKQHTIDTSMVSLWWSLSWFVDNLMKTKYCYCYGWCIQMGPPEGKQHINDISMTVINDIIMLVIIVMRKKAHQQWGIMCANMYLYVRHHPACCTCSDSTSFDNVAIPSECWHNYSSHQGTKCSVIFLALAWCCVRQIKYAMLLMYSHPSIYAF